MTYEEELAKKKQAEEEARVKAEAEKAQKEADDKTTKEYLEKQQNKIKLGGGIEDLKEAGKEDIRNIKRTVADITNAQERQEKKDAENPNILTKGTVGASDIEDLKKLQSAQEEKVKEEKAKDLEEKNKKLSESRNVGGAVKASAADSEGPVDFTDIPEVKTKSGISAKNVLSAVANASGKSEAQIKDDKHIAESSDSANALLDKQSDIDWNSTYNNMEKSGKAFNQIDDKYVQNMPKFLLQSYFDGDFGDPKGKDSKLRLAYFVMNGLQSQLKNASNAANVAAGKTPLYNDTTSDWEKIRSTNLQKGLEQKWAKNNAELQSAVNIAQKRGIDEEDSRSIIGKIQTNNTLAANMTRMNADQQAYVIEVYKDIGDMLGDMDLDQFTNFITGSAVAGGNVDPKTTATIIAVKGAKELGLLDKAEEIIQSVPEGNFKTQLQKIVTQQ